eukprot:XP_011437737.1 PREDICTED: putative nuclease HARBI1 [Crassostrea gigas]
MAERRKRTFKPRVDPLRSMSAAELQAIFRFNQEVQPDMIRKHQADFFGIAQFPGVIGAIDGTHVRILTPSEHEPEYVNRKNFHSINVQLVCDASHRIHDLVSTWPGGTHDARILRESGLFQLFERRLLPVKCHLIGDSGYPAKDWLLTPFLNPANGSQSRFNRSENM